MMSTHKNTPLQYLCKSNHIRSKCLIKKTMVAKNISVSKSNECGSYCHGLRWVPVTSPCSFRTSTLKDSTGGGAKGRESSSYKEGGQWEGGQVLPTEASRLALSKMEVALLK